MRPPYTVTSRILELVASISEKIGEVNAAHLERPPAELRKTNRIRTIQSSLEIEGNSLSFDQITDVLDKKRVYGPKKDIVEVQNAIQVYDKLGEFAAVSLDSLLRAHKLMMGGLIESAGKLRTKHVAIVKGSKITHLAPGGEMVIPLLKNLFAYLKRSRDIALIKSCVFHYEFQFIHPFLDGNGRMGRLWQTLILKAHHPVFEYLPIETIAKKRQEDYYSSLSLSDKSGNPTAFIEFMLSVILESLEELLSTQSVSFNSLGRITMFKAFAGNHSFTRKDYLRKYKEISTATASRDFREAVKKGILTRSGDKRTTKYRFSD